MHSNVENVAMTFTITGMRDTCCLVSYHWKDSGGSMAVFDGKRTPLLLPLNPSDERIIVVDIEAPE